MSQPGARVTAGGRGLGRLLHSLPGRTVEASWDGRLVPTPPPMRSAHERPLRLCPGPSPPQALRWQRGHPRWLLECFLSGEKLARKWPWPQCGAPDAAAPVGLVVALPLGTRETEPGLGASFRKQPE